MTTYALKPFYRPHALPSPGIPLGARSVGEYRVLPGWKDNAFRKSFFQIFWGVAGKGRIVIEDDPCELGPGTVAMYAPGMLHRVEATAGPWHYRWFTVDGPEAPAIVARLGLRPGVHPADPAPGKLFDELAARITGVSRKDELESGALAYRLLCAAVARITPEGGPERHAQTVNLVIELCRRHWSDPDCNVAFLADRMKLHRSGLSRMFSAAMGVGPGEYLSEMRLANARSLLRETATPVADIARQCGFADPDYFTRLFRNRTGCTPRDYRTRPDGFTGQ